MKCHVEMRCDNVDFFRELLSEWSGEHAGYYALPHGNCDLPRESGPSIGPEKDDPIVMYAKVFFEAGYRSLEAPEFGLGGRWLTCAGNYTAILIKEEAGVHIVNIWLDGRRHGIRMPFPKGLSFDPQDMRLAGEGVEGKVLVYETLTPTAAPWAKDLVANPVTT